MDYTKYSLLWDQLIKKEHLQRDVVEKRVQTQFRFDLKIKLGINTNPKADMLVDFAWDLASNSDPLGMSFFDCIVVCHDITKKLTPLII